MLLGCCHCGEEPPSESIPPSESTPPSESVSESDGISIRGIDCGDCDAVPFRWKVTLSGWEANPLLPLHQTCCLTRNGVFYFNAQTTGLNLLIINGVLGTSYCRVWSTSERSKNQAASPPSCADSSSPWMAMGIRVSAGVTVMGWSIYTPVGFGSETHSFQASGAGVCFQTGLLTYNSSASTAGARCKHGTVYVEPA